MLILNVVLPDGPLGCVIVAPVLVWFMFRWHVLPLRLRRRARLALRATWEKGMAAAP
ncbi:hypothetical protein ACFWUW_32575 [Streptomyces sp. NPDC058655]|uniref:hypothetical protein n=1 Tax=Streptomyces sp. NPDC058655 TaxID=3346577 RepID=UPI003646A501